MDNSHHIKKFVSSTETSAFTEKGHLRVGVHDGNGTANCWPNGWMTTSFREVPCVEFVAPVLLSVRLLLHLAANIAKGTGRDEMVFAVHFPVVELV